MYKSRLFTLLQTLEKKEMTRFGEFVNAPYFNKHKDVRTLCTYLKSCYPNFTEKNCERTLIYQKVFGNEKFDQKKLNLIFTYTIRLLERFFIVEQLNEQEHVSNLLLIRKLRKKELFGYLEKKMEKTEIILGKDEIQDSTHYRLSYELARESDEYYNQQSKHLKDQSIQQKQNSLDSFFISEKLKDACEMLVRNKLLKVNYSIQLLEEVNEQLSSNFEAYQDKPPILIYHQLYQLLVSDKEEHFYKFVQILEENIHHFRPSEQKDIYDYAKNFCIGRINKGQESFLEEYFKLNQAQLKKDLLMHSGYLLEWHYKNMVTVGLRLQKYEWVEHFIESYKEQLHQDARENAYRYNLAAYYYETEQYAAVLERLGQVEFSDIRYSFGAKSILLRTLYDLAEYDAFFAHCHAFKIYINRNKLISDLRKKRYYNLIKYAKKLADLKLESTALNSETLEKQFDKIKNEIQDLELVFNKKWLLEKVVDF